MHPVALFRAGAILHRLRRGIFEKNVGLLWGCGLRGESRDWVATSVFRECRGGVARASQSPKSVIETRVAGYEL